MDALLAQRAVTTVHATNIPLWALIVVVIGGTVLVVSGVGFALLCAQQCRRQARRSARRQGRRRMTVIDGVERVISVSEASSTVVAGAAVGKLRKKQQRVDEESSFGGGSSPIVGDEYDEEEHARVVAKMAPVLPRISRLGSGLFSLAGSSAQSTKSRRESGLHQGYHAGHRRQTSNPWVDEDAIHGPEMSPQGKKKGKGKKLGIRRSWRLSIRESWPLRSMSSVSPTLPKLAVFGSPALSSVSENAEKQEQHQHQHQNSRGNSLPAFHFPRSPMPSLPPPTNEQQDPALTSSPPRQLPKPPRQALLAANAELAGLWSSGGGGGTIRSVSGVGGYRGSTKYCVYKDASGALRLPPRLGSSGDGRLEERLSKRSMLAPSAMGRTERGAVTIVSGIPNDSTATLVGSGSISTPSPPKTNTKHSSYHHQRENSQNSIVSEADSLYDGLSPGLGGYYHGLTSPVKPSQLVRPHSASSSVDSTADHSLSTINEAASANSDDDEDNTQTTVKPLALKTTPTMPDAMRRMAEFSSNSRSRLDEDPFFVSQRNSSPATYGSNHTRAAPRGKNAFIDAPRLLAAPSRSEITLRSDSPLSTISGNSRCSPEPAGSGSGSGGGGGGGVYSKNVVRAVHQQQTTPQGQQQQRVSVPMSAVSSASNLLTLHRRQLSTVHDAMENSDEEDSSVGGLSTFATIPGLSLRSPSDRDDSPISKRLAELRVRPSSPTLGRGGGGGGGGTGNWSSREHTPDMAPPSLAISQGPWEKIGTAGSHLSYASNSNTSWRRAAGEVRRLSDASSRYSGHERHTMDAMAELSDLINGEILHKPSPPLSLSLSPQEQQEQFRAYEQLATVRLVPAEDYRMPVVSTVAQLRRMNSQLSTYSNAASGYSDLSSAEGVGLGVLPTLREEESSQRDSARHYLSVGSIDTPAKRFLRAEERRRSPERKSSESLGLYDADGFWISPERRARK